MSKKKKDFGWEYLDSSETSSYNGEDGSWGYKNSDGSGSWHGKDGSWGYKDSDGSGSWHGSDGAWGYWNSDGTSTYYGKDNEVDHDSYDTGTKLASGLAGFLTELGNQAMSSSSKKNKHSSNVSSEKEESKEDWKFLLIFFGAIFFLMIFCGVMYFILNREPKPGANEIKLPLSYKEYKGENYKQVREEFEDMGFENIECVGMKDLITGWINKENSVEKISIAGDTKFKEGDIFNKDAEIIIRYHSFKKKK